MPIYDQNEKDFDQFSSNPLSDDLVRPAFDSLFDGVFPATVQHADVVKTGSRKMLRLHALFQDEEGNEMEESLLVAPDWKPGSPFRKLLELSECLPEPNERLNLNELVGITFLFTIKINSKNGRDYVNLVDVALPDEEE